MKKSIVIVFLIMVGTGLTIFHAIRVGAYPVAVVDQHMITAHHFEEASASVNRYYDQMLKTYRETDPSLQDKSISLPEVRRATLDKLIENVFIGAEYDAVVGENVEPLVTEKVTAAEKENPQFSQAVETLYGLTIERFKEVILKSQAKEEMLKEKKADFTDWLVAKRKNAKVYILVSDLQWDGEKVINK